MSGRKVTGRGPWIRRTAAAVVTWLVAAVALAQFPVPTSEQIEAFGRLPPAQQQALLRELQGSLPPAQRRAVLQMLQAGQTGQSAARDAGPDDRGDDPNRLLSSLLEGADSLGRDDLERFQPKFGANDTLVLQLEQDPERPLRPADGDQQRVDEFADRLAAGNPYQLDSVGQLHLPGIPAIALAGLSVTQATVRLSAEPALRLFDVTVTRLPLEPIGTDALKPFGHEIFRERARDFLRSSNMPVPLGYVIGPGDTVNVQLFGNQNAEYFLEVSREGVINFPNIGPISVAGLSFTALRDTITARVTEQMIGVRASVTLGELRSVQVFVVGDVVAPGAYTVGGMSTIMNALLMSGGVTDIGSLRRVQLRREGETVGTLDLYDLLLRGDTSADLRLQSDDVIFVPPIGDTVAIHGEVRRPAIYELSDERTMSDVVQLSGGLTARANMRAVKLERVVASRGTNVVDVDISSPAGSGVELRNGDVVRVLPNLSLLEDSVRVEGNVQQPGLYEWSEGMRLADVLPSSEYVLPKTDLNYVLIRRETAPNVQPAVISADLAAAWRNRASDDNVRLEPRDTLYVFNRDIGRGHIVGPLLEELRIQAPSNQPLPVVRVGGRVRAAGEYPLEAGMRISDLLRAGGGLSDAAYGIDAELSRYSVINGEYRETELITVNLVAALAGDAAANIALAPYDFLNVKEVPRWREQQSVAIRGEVRFPGVYPIRQGEKLSSVLERAGGLTDFAFPAGSVFTRVEEREREREQLDVLARRIEGELASLSLSDPGSSDAITTGRSLIDQLRTAEATGRVVMRLDDLLAGDEQMDVVLKGGDELVVPDTRQSVTIIGEVQYPTSHLHERGIDLNEYISRSGGLTDRSDRRRIYVVRANGEVVIDRRSGWFSRSGRLDIRAGDTIVVPMDVDRVRPLAGWSSITQIVYNLAIAAAAVNSF